MPGLARHYYDNSFWPKKIENTVDEMTMRFLENHIVLIPLEPRRPGCSVVDGKSIDAAKVESLANAAEACWDAILRHDLAGFAESFRTSFEAQVAMFPGMVDPTVNGNPCPEASVRPDIGHWSAVPGVLAWKLAGAGGGGYLILAVEDSEAFSAANPDAVRITVRR